MSVPLLMDKAKRRIGLVEVVCASLRAAIRSSSFFIVESQKIPNKTGDEFKRQNRADMLLSEMKGRCMNPQS